MRAPIYGPLRGRATTNRWVNGALEPTFAQGFRRLRRGHGSHVAKNRELRAHRACHDCYTVPGTSSSVPRRSSVSGRASCRGETSRPGHVDPLRAGSALFQGGTALAMRRAVSAARNLVRRATKGTISMRALLTAFALSSSLSPSAARIPSRTSTRPSTARTSATATATATTRTTTPRRVASAATRPRRPRVKAPTPRIRATRASTIARASKRRSPAARIAPASFPDASPRVITAHRDVRSNRAGSARGDRSHPEGRDPLVLDLREPADRDRSHDAPLRIAHRQPASPAACARVAVVRDVKRFVGAPEPRPIARVDSFWLAAVHALLRAIVSEDAALRRAAPSRSRRHARRRPRSPRSCLRARAPRASRRSRAPRPRDRASARSSWRRMLALGRALVTDAARSRRSPRRSISRASPSRTRRAGTCARRAGGCCPARPTRAPARGAARGSTGSCTVEITVGQPSTSSPFIMMRLVGSTLALGAPRCPLPCATNGVAAQPTIRKRAPNAHAAQALERDVAADAVVDDVDAAPAGERLDLVAERRTPPLVALRLIT